MTKLQRAQRWISGFGEVPLVIMDGLAIESAKVPVIPSCRCGKKIMAVSVSLDWWAGEESMFFGNNSEFKMAHGKKWQNNEIHIKERDSPAFAVMGKESLLEW